MAEPMLLIRFPHGGHLSIEFAGTGAVIMGNTTFEVGVGPWGDDPTFHAPCFVVSHHSREMIVKQGGTSACLAGRAEHARLRWTSA